jgi:hypothetical protein
MELNDLCSTPNTICVIKLRRMRWDFACCMYGGEERCMQHFWWENLRERDFLEGPGIDGRTVLRCLFRKWDGGHGLG